MTSHADTIRRELERHTPDVGERAFAALDALLAENQRLKDEAQDMVLAAAYHEMRVLRDAAVAENERLREALEWARNSLDTWAVFREPQTYAVSTSSEMRDIIARLDEALAGDAE